MNQGETISLTKKESSRSDDIDPLGCRGELDKQILFDVKSKKENKEESFIDNDTALFLKSYYPDVLPSEWNSWKWQIKNSITDYTKLERIFGISIKERELIEKKLPFRITPYYASIVFNSEELRKTVIPSIDELLVSEGEEIDPLHEDVDSPVDGVVHRYPDRALFLATSFCSTNCRYCTRSRIVCKRKSKEDQISNWEKGIEYIKSNKSIRDVIISGGDPLTLSDGTLDKILSKIREIEHVEVIRIGTKAPVVLPMRITKSLITVLRKYHPLYMSIHFTHPAEISPYVRNACNLLADAGIPLGSQTVLLKGINNNPETMKALYHKLLKIRVKPYYLYQCDPIIGSAHFRTSVDEGINIIESLRGWTSGYAIPHYVIDAPGGGGKIPILPEYYLGKDSDGSIRLRNYEKNSYSYPAIK